MNGTLVIHGVDFDLLENQRLRLTAAIDAAQRGGASEGTLEALAGIQNMLDDWSDERAAIATENEWRAKGYTGKRLPDGSFDIPAASGP